MLPLIKYKNLSIFIIIHKSFILADESKFSASNQPHPGGLHFKICSCQYTTFIGIFCYIIDNIKN